MKKLLMILVIMAMAMTANAATLRWDASTGEVDGYNIYFTDGIENFTAPVGGVTEVLDIDNTFNLLPGKTYTFSVTAWNSVGESGPSNEAVYVTASEYTPPEWNIPVKKEKPSVIINLILE